MSSGFTKNFETTVGNLASTLNTKGNSENPNSRFSEVPVSSSFLAPGDIVFFRYTSEKYKNNAEHITMLIGNKRSKTGIYLGRKKLSKTSVVYRNYMAAVKLNNIWSFTASLIVAAYNNNRLKYVKKPKTKAPSVGPAPWIALVGRENYRSYIVNNMIYVNKLNKPKESVNG
jgi:hypothetical protein